MVDPKIAVIGGGTGSFTLLQELKELTPEISAIVNMSDDGGSTGDLRDEFDVLPPGDIRQCLVALSTIPEMRDLFSFRFPGEGDLSGHTIGNLLLTGIELQQGSFEAAIDLASRLLQITGHVVPVTLEKHDLVLEDEGQRVVGEYEIAHRPISSQARISHSPPVPINPRAAEAIEAADLVIIAPGNLYGSLIPALAVRGMQEAFMATKAKKVMVANLVTKPGQTDGWHVVDYVRAIERYAGEGQINFVMYNQNLPPSELIRKYAAEGEFPVDIERSRFEEVGAMAIGADLIAGNVAAQDPNDKAIRRTLIRHNAGQVGQELLKILS